MHLYPRSWLLASRLGVAILVTAIVSSLVVTAPAVADGPFTLDVASGGTTSIDAATMVSAGDEGPVSFDEAIPGDDAGADDGFGGAVVNRSPATGAASGRSVQSGKNAKSQPELLLSFHGLNLRDQRLANNGNQFFVEPPDQGLCVGNGFVLESVNDVLRIFDASGNAVSGVVDLNTFYGYAPAIDRAHGNARGPSITDPTCHFDPATGRFINVVLTLDHVGTTAALNGKNHLDVAVSNTSDPRGTWTIYRIPAQNDGTQGTPNHGCTGGPCLADFPHIGVDRSGVYITTNEFPFFARGFHAANIYAISKAELTSGAASIRVTVLDTIGSGPDGAGFTVWPAITPGDQFSDDAGGTEYFVSSRAVFADTDTSESLLVWALTNTSSLATTPALTLQHTLVTVGTYGVPARSTQKAGDWPLGQCINDPTCRPLLGLAPTAPAAVFGKLDSSDSRILGLSYANGKLWATLGTAVTVDGEDRAGVGWYVLKASTSTGLAATLAQDGILALAHNNLIYPTVGVTASGRGVLAFTVVGDDHHPSAGYAPIDAIVGAGDVAIAAEGLGPQDGFTEYGAFATRPRWGDYGAAAVDGKTVWVASEYIGQTCTLTQYRNAPLGSCSGTRVTLGNWGTRISKIVP